MFVSAPLQASVSLSYPSSSCSGSNPAELAGSYGLAGVNVGTTIVFVGKDRELSIGVSYSTKEQLRYLVNEKSSLKRSQKKQC